MIKQSSNTGRKPGNGNSVRHRRPLAAALSLPETDAEQQCPVLITGGAGFIGTNLARHFLSAGRPVRIFDNLSRPGVERNLACLREKFGELVQIEVGDVEECAAVQKAVQGVAQVYHFAAQVAVTTSLNDPFLDFEVNARGTLNLLEALRELSQPPPLVFTSTNKVYGELGDVALRCRSARYEPEDARIRASGFNESRPLAFHSPYGCSKGAADQYVLDYARTFGLPAVVFRMSCIYGPHQFGTEDQGWVAHFLIRGLEGKPVTVYGDGKQVRDVLFVEDLVQAFLLAQRHMPAISGQAFNIGGGPAHTISLLELIEIMTEVQGKRPLVRFDDWRPADQQYYVSDIRRFSQATGWRPLVTVPQGIERLSTWLRQMRKPAGVPVVVPEAPHAAGAAGYKELQPVKACPNAITLPVPEARSKRLWKAAALERAPLPGKIIKFP